MTAAEREKVVALLPEETPEELLGDERYMSQGNEHLDEAVQALYALRDYFKERGIRAYVASDMFVYYPNEVAFAPDLMVVMGAKQRNRSSWIERVEKRALDMCVEVVGRNSRKKDLWNNIEFYAHLGIPEYFLFDLTRKTLKGYDLDRSENRYVDKPVVLAKSWRVSSKVLGLDLAVVKGSLRFYDGDKLLPRPHDRAKAEAKQRRVAEKRAESEAEQRRMAEERAETEALQRRVAEERAKNEARRAETEAEQRRVAEERARALEELLRAAQAQARAVGKQDPLPFPIP